MTIALARRIVPRKLRQQLAPVFHNVAVFLGRKTLPFVDNKPNAVIFLAPNYGNIGDLAIGYSQEKFLEAFDKFNVISVPISDTYSVLRFARKNLKPNDLIFLVGGGNIGDFYSRPQRGREFIVNYLDAWPIISFPQSVVYSYRPGYESSAKREAQSLSKASKYLTLFARETKSLSMMKEFFPGEIGYSPDIVFSLLPTFQKEVVKPRGGVMLVLRKDAERNLSNIEHDTINSIAASYGKISERDHGIPNDTIDQSDPFRHALNLLEEYRQTSLVITDRLHGMIFAAITGTPCIVLPNSNHKITQTYFDWVEEQCPYIKLVETFSNNQLLQSIREVLAEEATSNYSEVTFDFSELQKSINRYIQ